MLMSPITVESVVGHMRRMSVGKMSCVVGEGLGSEAKHEVIVVINVQPQTIDVLIMIILFSTKY